ncbi:MAG: hypothetical protein AAF514_11470 [Verrucomicrobiota bacterium]
MKSKLPYLVFLSVPLLFSQCTTLPVSERGYVGRSNMQFEGQGAYNYECQLLSQIETGRAGSGGQAGGGCSSCH